MIYNEIEQTIDLKIIYALLIILFSLAMSILIISYTEYYEIKNKILLKISITTRILLTHKKIINLTNNKLTCIINTTKEHNKKYIINNNNFNYENIFNNLQKFFEQKIHFAITRKQHRQFIIPRIQSGEIERQLINEYIYIVRKYKNKNLFEILYDLWKNTYSSYHYLEYSNKYNDAIINNNPYNEIKKLNY